MGEESKFVFTKPKQIPLFEELEDGSLEQFKKKE
jgi:hypothetical protein